MSNELGTADVENLDIGPDADNLFNDPHLHSISGLANIFDRYRKPATSEYPEEVEG